MRFERVFAMVVAVCNTVRLDHDIDGVILFKLDLYVSSSLNVFLGKVSGQ